MAIPPAEALEDVIGRQVAQWPSDQKPQSFRVPIPTRLPVGTLRFTVADAANVTKALDTRQLIAERLIINNRSIDNSGVATKGFSISVGDGSSQAIEVAVGGAVELFNENISMVRVAYEGLVNLAGAEIVFVGWIAHGALSWSEREVTAAEVSERHGAT